MKVNGIIEINELFIDIQFFWKVSVGERAESVSESVLDHVTCKTEGGGRL